MVGAGPAIQRRSVLQQREKHLLEYERKPRHWLHRTTFAECGCCVGIIGVTVQLTAPTHDRGLQRSSYVFPLLTETIERVVPDGAASGIVWLALALLYWTVIGALVDMGLYLARRGRGRGDVAA